MMLAVLGLATVVVLLAVIISKRMAPMVALIIVPLVAAVIGGYGFDVGKFVIAGIRNVAPVAANFVFVIMYFGVMMDAGMITPVIDKTLRLIGEDPVKIAVGTVCLAMLVHLGGAAPVTFLITVSTLLPVYKELHMDKRVLACLTGLGAGVMEFIPWTGPAIRAAAVLDVTVIELFIPMIPVLLVGIGFALVTAWWLGKKETQRLQYDNKRGRRRLGVKRELTPEAAALVRPQLLWFNVLLTVGVLGSMITGKLPPVVAFMVGTAIALLVNYPKPSEQLERVNAHAKTALMMASLLFAAGTFIGIMSQTGMMAAMAKTAVGFVPQDLASYIPVVLGLISVPLSLVFDPDSFYFGVLPIVAEMGSMLGIDKIQIGQAVLLGQMTTGFSVSLLAPSTLLLVSLTEVDFTEHQRFTFPYLWAAGIVMTIAAVLLGRFPL